MLGGKQGPTVIDDEALYILQEATGPCGWPSDAELLLDLRTAQ